MLDTKANPSQHRRPPSAGYPLPSGKRLGARIPPAPAAHRWVGPFFCVTESCGTVLGEIFADAQGTYLASIGGRPVRNTVVQCPDCGLSRHFHGQPARLGTGALPPLDESGYDLANRNAGTATA